MERPPRFLSVLPRPARTTSVKGQSAWWARWGGAITFLKLTVFFAGAQTPLELQIQFNQRLQARITWSPHSEPALYTLESLDGLSGRWKPIPPAGQWPIEDTTFLDERASFLPTQRFFRVLADPLPEPPPGQVVSFEKTDSLSRDEVADWLARLGISAFQIESGVELYYVAYETTNASGESVSASGAVITPTDFNRPLPFLSFQHNVALDRETVPSRFNFDSLEALIPMLVAAQGFVTAAPDYIGMGDSPGFHPLFIADAAANAVADILPIAEKVAQAEGLTVNEELYLLGYGEGGYATMAAHRSFESDEDAPYMVTASAAMAGPHDLSGIMLDHLLTPDLIYPEPYLLLYLLRAYDEQYDLYDNPIEVFTEAVAGQILPRLNGRTPGDTINELLPSTTPRDLLQPRFVEALEADPDHPFRVALRENDVYDWAPQAPIRLYHCEADETVPKSNSEKALDAFSDNGSGQGQLFDLIPVLEHNECDGVSFTSAIIWLRDLAN